MFWLRQPPYLRWIIAAVVLAVGVLLDIRPAAVVDYPYAANHVHAGQSIANHIEWRQVPARIMPGWDGEVAGYAATDVAAGTPLLPALVAAAAVPDGWWSVAIALPHAIGIGTPIRTSVGGVEVTGILSGEVVDTGYQYVGPVAFPADEAVLVAEAVASGAVVVMIGSAGSIPASAG